MHHVHAQRTELRELNDLNFARFGARLAQFEATIVGRIETKLEQRIGALDTKIEHKAADLMKWSLVFWVGAVGAIAALAGVLG